jgi:hypothetical protein
VAGLMVLRSSGASAIRGAGDDATIHDTLARLANRPSQQGNGTRRQNSVRTESHAADTARLVQQLEEETRLVLRRLYI